ncbi:MAG: hypothetical protein U0Q18_33750 [Bryobacteraceae bacterium]
MKSALLLLAVCPLINAQNAPPKWVHTTQDDPLHAITLDVFVLQGKFLTPPSKLPEGLVPEIVMRCSNNRLKAGYITVGAVVDRGAAGAKVEMRLDGKFKTMFWGVGTDGTAVFMDGLGFATVIWGTWLPHKEGKGETVKHEIIGVREAFGNTIVMQFDMPDEQDEMLNACTYVRNHRRFSAIAYPFPG